MKKVLICANPDLNFVDGSSIWLNTIARVLAKVEETTVDIILRSPVENDRLFKPLLVENNIRLIDGTQPQYWQGKGFARIGQEKQAELACRFDGYRDYNCIVVRGLEIASLLAKNPEVLAKTWIYLTDIPHSLDEIDPSLRKNLETIALGCQRLLCQTEELSELWKAIVPSLPQSKISIYSPVIPDFDIDTVKSISDKEQVVVYAGKYKPEWKTLEMAKLWGQTQIDFPDADLVMIGDKIHNEAAYPNFYKDMHTALSKTKGLNWLGAISREQVLQTLVRCRVGLSWRCESINEISEYSTKILEYGAAGCCAIINRSSIHEKLLGKDYPLFVNSESEYIDKLGLALSDDSIAQKAANRLTELAYSHTLTARVSIVSKWLGELPVKEPAKTVLVAGHDLKFFALIQDKLEKTGRFRFITDKWLGHNKHDEMQSKSLLPFADVIFCEWCLGNLEWYSKHKLPTQRLVARFHAQETKLPYLKQSDWKSIDLVSFVSEHTRKEALHKINFPTAKTVVIPNYLDSTKFTQKKKTGESKYTLGMIGIVPSTKRLDRAIDLLEALLKEDNRYCLRIKGKHPLEYPWLLNRPEELDYYKEIFRRINETPELRHKIIFDPAGDDVNDWFTMVGYILSPSEFESFHMAVGEGILTGAKPIIWPWKGASEIWGSENIYATDHQREKAILNSDSSQEKGDIISYLEISIDIWEEVLLHGRIE